MKQRRVIILLGATAILASILGCVVSLGGPKYPTPMIPISTEAMGEMQSSMETAVAAGSFFGQVTLVFTEPQLTSFLAYKLKEQSSAVISDPQVYLRDDQIQIYGTATQGNFQVTARIILSAIIDDQNQLKIELSSADFGPLPVPKGLLDILSATIQEALTGSLGPVATGFRLQTITIQDGTMTITGRIK